MTKIGLVLGTGVNASLELPVSIIASHKFGSRPRAWYDHASTVLTNTELGFYGKGVLPMTRWDEQLNAAHLTPDLQPLEYLIGGRYVGEIIRLIIVEAIQTTGLLDGLIPKELSEPYSLEMKTVAEIER